MPYSGPASAYGVIGKAEAAYFRMINDRGGINGRKINLISLDDGYSPPKTVEQTRRLVEQERRLHLQRPRHRANARRPPLSQRKQDPASLLRHRRQHVRRPEELSLDVGWQPNYQTEAKIYAKHIVATRPDAKVAILYQNDGFGKDTEGVQGRPRRRSCEHGRQGSLLRDLGADSRFAGRDAAGSGADLFVIAATPKFAAQAIRKAYDVGWTPSAI